MKNEALANEAERVFQKTMEHCRYGKQETLDALRWFREGYRAALRANAAPPSRPRCKFEGGCAHGIKCRGQGHCEYLPQPSSPAAGHAEGGDDGKFGMTIRGLTRQVLIDIAEDTFGVMRWAIVNGVERSYPSGYEQPCDVFPLDHEPSPDSVVVPREPKRGLHPATLKLVGDFATALAEKLSAAEQKYGHTDGWMSKHWMDECRQKLREHVEKGDPRDVAAYCAFLWHHGESISVRVEDELLKYSGGKVSLKSAAPKGDKHG